MLKNEVFEAVEKKDLPLGTKVIDSTWACKKKSNGILRGRLNARGFRQIDGQYYDGTSIHAPVRNATTIRIVLVRMLLARWIAQVIDVKGESLHGEFNKGEEIYMKVPEGWESYYPETAVLKLLKCIYGLKQAAMAFWTELLRCMKHMEMKRSTADPCLYHKWTENRLVLMVSWIDDNLIVGSEKATMETKGKLMDRFECTDEGDLSEFVGSKIDRTEDGGLKFTQPVLIQTFKD